MSNAYLPLPMRVARIAAEDPARSLRTFDLVFEDPADRDAFRYLPGQFCEMSVLGRGESPFGIASSPTEEGFLRFTVNRTGSVTAEIHDLREGDRVGLRGPLGNWYPVDLFRGGDVVIIGGGFAFTTLRSLLVYLLAHREDYRTITVVYGARNPGLLLYKEELEAWAGLGDPGLRLHLTIDRPADGWVGTTGFVPGVTKGLAPSPDGAHAVVCGPPVMIKFTLPVLAGLGFPDDRIFTSLERRMKCGIGKCGRCNIGPRYVCIDGPVFSMAELRENPEPV